MRSVVIGLGVQGQKRVKVAGESVVATVDPVVPEAQYRTVDQVPLDSYDAALVCTPDGEKVDILNYLLSNRKHVLVEKPLTSDNQESLTSLKKLVNTSGVACYTAYNHRFEPHIVRLKELLDSRELGEVYVAKYFYGNGTAQLVKGSAWRDTGLGALGDLGSHLLDLSLFLLGQTNSKFELWSARGFETQSWDHVLFGSRGKPFIELETTFLSWRNSFSIDVLAERGSAHINGLCKWGPSTFTVRRRVYPSGVPHEEVQTIESPDPTWEMEYRHFEGLCRTGGTNIGNDCWINRVLKEAARSVAD